MRVHWLIAFLLSACAVPVPPGGGPPDATPPGLESSSPASGSVRVSGREISLTFNEAVDKASFAQAWSITPDVVGPTDVSWRGRRVTLRFGEAFREETTYILNVETAFRDARGVRLASPMSIAFATGDRLNEGAISGEVRHPLTGQPFGGLDIFAYVPGDSIGVASPLYRTQSGRDGRFRFTNLSETEYAIAGIGDANRNRRLDPGELLAVAPVETIRADSSGAALFGYLLPVRHDPVAPELNRVQAATTRDLALRFSEPVGWMGNVTAATGSDISILDSLGRSAAELTSNMLYPVRSQGHADRFQEWRLRVPPLSPPLRAGSWTLSGSIALADSAGNRVPSGSWPFTVGASLEAPPEPVIVRVLPDSGAVDADGAYRLWPGSTLDIWFSAPLDSTTEHVSDALLQDTSGVPLDVPGKWLDATTYRFETAVLPLDQHVQVISMDEPVTYIRQGRSTTGDIMGAVQTETAVVVELRREDGVLLATRNVEPGLSSFRFSDLPGGLSYVFRLYGDRDGNGAWTPGRLIPFNPPEPIVWADGTEPVRARWETVRADTLHFAY